MSDVSKLGPLGEGDETRPLKVDLTRIDIRRGTLNLPRRFYDALPEGEIEANDVSLGRKLIVTFVPPRELEGLAPFFEEHDLQPNDAVTISVAGGLQLTPIKRERRQEREEGKAPSAIRSEPARTSEPSNEPAPEFGYVRERAPERGRGDVTGRNQAGQRQADRQAGQSQPGQHQAEQRQAGQQQTEDDHVGERVRLEARRLGREKPAQSEERKEPEQTRVRLRAQEPAAYLAPPTPAMKGGWQDVLHDPAPRRDQMLRPSERAVVRPDDQPAEGSVRERRESSDARSELGQRPLFGAEPEAYGTVREAPRQETRPGKPGPAGSQPLAPRQEADDEQQHGQPRDRNVSNRSGTGVGGQSRRGAEDHSAPATRPQHHVQAEPELEAEREPVLVGGAQAEGDVTGRISSYLRNPSTPAIVRATQVAEELRLPLEAVQQGLAEVSRNSDGAVTSIRADVYLVKRGG